MICYNYNKIVPLPFKNFKQEILVKGILSVTFDKKILITYCNIVGYI